MGCDEARRILWPLEELRIVGPEVADARAHVRSCPECEAYFAQDRALLDLYAKARSVSAPMSLRLRVFDDLAQSRRSPPSGPTRPPPGPTNPPSRWETVRRLTRRYGPWPAAMAALLALVLIGKVHDRGMDAGASDVFVEDYLRRAVGQEFIVSRDPGEVRRFLERELGLRVEPLALDGFSIVRAEICLLEGKRGAMIVYEGADGRVSHYVVPREDTKARPPTITTGSLGDPMPVVTWSTVRVEQALVGELAPQRLLALATASSVSPPARASRKPPR
ncbi:MAG: hypothetical protein R3304_09105 [Longimicrobiales bacterium]|nr:hypothetical protein [Longimicrobiales bacterium]